MGNRIMTKAQEMVERDIGRMVIRIYTLTEQLSETLDENDKLRSQLAKLTTEVHTNGS